MIGVVAMLRAVNLGSHNRINMDELRALFESLNLRHVQTVLQSGNVVFGTAERDFAPLVERISAGIERRFGVQVEIILRSAAEMSDVIRRNPFEGRKDIHPSKLLVVFLSEPPRADTCQKLLDLKADREEVEAGRRELYIYYAHGFARSKLTLKTIEKTVGTTGTARNWNTTNKVLEMASNLEAGKQP